MSWIELDCSRPAMAKLRPLLSSMVVEARRVRIAGMVTTAVEVSGTLTEPAAESSLTSGATLKLMRSPMMVGVKARLTPTCLYCTVMVPTRVPPWGTISGISPPARKLAVSPDMAIRLGSASTVAWLWVARKSNSVLSPLSEVWKASAPEAAPPVAEMVRTAKPPRMAPVPNRAMLLMFCQLMPTRFSASRLTSATLTRSWTWVGASDEHRRLHGIGRLGRRVWILDDAAHLAVVGVAVAELGGGIFAARSIALFVRRILQAAQHQRQVAHLDGKRHDLGLLRGELQRRGLGDVRLVARREVELLVHRDHARVAQDRLGGVVLAVRAGQRVGQQDIDAITGIDEARDRRGRRGRYADGAQAGLQHGGKEAPRARHDDVALDDRLADMALAARDCAHEVADRPLAFDNVGRRQVALRPRLPTQVVGFDELSGVDGAARHQHLHRGLGGRALPAHLGGDRGTLGLQPGAGEEGRGAGDDD